MWANDLVRDVVQHVFPFFAYWVVKRRLDERRASDSILERSEYSGYARLSPDELDGRLSEEHERTERLEDKTFRLSFALTFGLAIFGLGSGLTIDRGLEVGQPVLWVLIGLGTTSAIYFWAAALLAAGALESVTMYGLGTARRLLAKDMEDEPLALLYARELACQELVNLNRHNRNNATYMSLRNGLVLLLVVGVVALIAFVSAETDAQETLRCLATCSR